MVEQRKHSCLLVRVSTYLERISKLINIFLLQEIDILITAILVSLNLFIRKTQLLAHPKTLVLAISYFLSVAKLPEGQ